MNFEIKKYNRHYENSAINLLNICFKGRNITKKSFNWKYFDKCYTGKQIAYIALDGDTVCSFVCFTPLTLVSNKKKYLFYTCAVQATLPSYRRNGLVSILTKTIEKKLNKKCKGYLGFSNKYGVKIDIHSKRINYLILGKFQMRYLFAKPFFLAYKVVKLEKKEFLHKNYDMKGMVQIIKSADYLNWRYIRNPKYKFEYIAIMKDNNIIGTAIIRKKFLNADICDILLKNSSDIKDCITALRGYAFKNKLLYLTFTYFQNNLLDNSFTNTLLKRNLNMYLTLKTKTKNLLMKENWYVPGGDIH